MGETSIKNPLQVKFFEKLKQSVPQNVSLANDIADLLEISADGAYRRMRGESILSMDEMVKLCNHYKIPPDIIGNPEDNAAAFSFKKMIHDEAGLEEYLTNILRDLQRINASNPKQIIFAASDIPVFHQFQFPYYAAFKVFFWQKAIMNLASFDGKKFSSTDITSKMSDYCKKISETYIRIPSIEIWHEDTVVSNLKLIEYAWDSGLFATKEDALLICQQISELLASVEKQAVKSSKLLKEEMPIATGKTENEGDFTMYQSDLLISNNHICVTAGTTRAIYLSHNTFNIMSTDNIIFCNETEAWLKSLMKKSLVISGVAEKQRHTFFKKAQEKVAALVSRISAQ